jgi:flavin reductase (DIM6/NTAB) family NADH-FMN oxidoreductase RutF
MSMLFDFDEVDSKQTYKLLTTLVVPRPIALVTTVDAAGRVNAAPFSWFNTFGSNPPIVAFAPGDRVGGPMKDTAANVKRTGEFVANLVDEALAEGMNACSADLAPGENELQRAGLTTAPSLRVEPPRIAESPAQLECVVHQIIEIGGNRMVIGLVKLLHVRDGVLDPETLRLNPEAYRLIGRMHGAGGYTRTREYFWIDRP